MPEHDPDIPRTQCAQITGRRSLPTPGFEGYRVDNAGDVESSRLTRKGIVWRRLRPRPNRKGYLRVALRRGGQAYDRKIHRLVLEAFVGPCPPGMVCRHLDGDPKNNRLDNLAWGTPAENVADAERHGTLSRGERHHSAKLTEEKAFAIRCWAETGMSQTALSRKFRVCRHQIAKVISGQNWKNAPSPFPLD